MRLFWVAVCFVHYRILLVRGFSVAAAGQLSRNTAAAHFSTWTLPVFSSAPSDSASVEDIYEGYGTHEAAPSIDSTNYVGDSTTNKLLVNNIMKLIPSSFHSSSVSPEQRNAISEALCKLEKLNPTKSPATSPLLNGVWELRYCGGYTSEWALPSPTRQAALFLYDGGYSPGIFAYTLAQSFPQQVVNTDSLVITISHDNPRVKASVGIQLFGGALDGIISVLARLDVESELRLRETYESTSVLGKTLNIPTRLQYTRDLCVTFVDDDLLIIRDASGQPEVLLRHQKDFHTTILNTARQ